MHNPHTGHSREDEYLAERSADLDLLHSDNSTMRFLVIAGPSFDRKVRARCSNILSAKTFTREDATARVYENRRIDPSPDWHLVV